MNAVEQLVRAPVAAVEFANLLLTRDDAKIGVTPKDIVWTHRKATLYRYRSTAAPTRCRSCSCSR